MKKKCRQVGGDTFFQTDNCLKTYFQFFFKKRKEVNTGPFWRPTRFSVVLVRGVPYRERTNSTRLEPRTAG